ncbi:ectoine synthase [Sneathiella chinensis]|uniref:L-ectoine synthase n=1 Tax=Sneathiella chinensis TaxID=349750 RepID=A0ABQ5U607_9PROT|nr:ectoine synthase [Sneathiella chinensis]GLQ05921.1 L-ectoine synthase [Sneathiella chinensis]
MIVRTLAEAEKTDRRVTSETWESTRLLLKDDQMGFSFHITTIYAGTTTEMWYRNHLEAVYCISGEGEIESIADGKVYPIAPGTIYGLDKHDKHILRAKTELKLACAFNPPVTGQEVHDETGAYPADPDANAA